MIENSIGINEDYTQKFISDSHGTAEVIDKNQPEKTCN
ncbi:hypothetical protein [uncultured Gammaproteobacteria bacterium]|jgi:hypothetical protein|nr:hypothetical protein BROOK1789B_563 [Bathymodiolus brooksi thiotrophic gill symbiont]CAC9528164.1 hypothetical protein [uncultured Gammaproteobacteria bacterium]CAB9544538.1 hypothetical protein BROOK1789C_1762 [Bathymodiolus brooksi thiotrophic gill symbiont]CAC9548877.1 hypothetical protein [uncultured Gammaproteobacteria bacterium]CAC9549801.1 hypothetical protein [uncultured Gammaproteobacteria bacterium]